ncbi:MAG: hypothetical protein V7K71_30335 [Nostoc sp.]|uniref:hypothetical protein n=1 Tax=Nostoc sp. TaxID=1180 RepID=UPI002FF8C4B4
MQILLVSDRNFLTPSIQFIAAHLSPVEQICQGLRLQTPASRRNARQSLPKVLPISSNSDGAVSPAFLRAIARRKQRRKMLLKTS